MTVRNEYIKLIKIILLRRVKNVFIVDHTIGLISLIYNVMNYTTSMHT